MKLKGFTLLEIVVVLIILGVLASLTIPQFIKNIEKSRQAEAIGILTRMYKGYKILIVDELLQPGGDFTNGTVFNPDESNILPNVPAGRSDLSWKSLGFQQNPNYDQPPNAYFSYDFLKTTEASSNRPSSVGSPLTATAVWGIAYRKLDNTWIAGMELFPVDFNKRILINMDTGIIQKSSDYQ